MKLKIRRSNTGDLLFLEELENISFLPLQRTSTRNIQHSIRSHFQEVYIVESTGKDKNPMGALTLFKYKFALRLYSIAVLPKYRNLGVGDFMMNFVFQYAKQHNYQRILLEMSATNHKLFDWYLGHGFKLTNCITNY
jgi:ribosomal protein S18 acetylase RimI-like enzyme